MTQRVHDYDFRSAGAALGDEIARLALARVHSQTGDLSNFDVHALGAEMAAFVTAGEKALLREGATAAEAAEFGNAAAARVSEIFSRFRATIAAANTDSEKGN